MRIDKETGIIASRRLLIYERRMQADAQLIMDERHLRTLSREGLMLSLSPATFVDSSTLTGFTQRYPIGLLKEKIQVEFPVFVFYLNLI